MRSLKVFFVAALLTLSSAFISASGRTNRSISNLKAKGAPCSPYWDLEYQDPNTGDIYTMHFGLARSIHEHDLGVQVKFLISHGWKIVGGGCE